jgi:antitoxin MazE
MNVTRTQIVKIGNSRGIRIPKVLLDQVGFGSEVEIAVQNGQLVIRSVEKPRKGWAGQFSALNGQGDDRLLDEQTLTQFDKDDWEW